jgi:hypothetical protein
MIYLNFITIVLVVFEEKIRGSPFVPTFVDHLLGAKAIQ